MIIYALHRKHRLSRILVLWQHLYNPAGAVFMVPLAVGLAGPPASLHFLSRSLIHGDNHG